MMKIDRKKEREEFEKMVSQHINAIVKHADKYNLDRDETFRDYAKIMMMAAEISTLRSYRIEEEK